jgi:hypothetical protein
MRAKKKVPVNLMVPAEPDGREHHVRRCWIGVRLKVGRQRKGPGTRSTNMEGRWKDGLTNDDGVLEDYQLGNKNLERFWKLRLPWGCVTHGPCDLHLPASIGQTKWEVIIRHDSLALSIFS